MGTDKNRSNGREQSQSLPHVPDLSGDTVDAETKAGGPPTSGASGEGDTTGDSDQRTHGVTHGASSHASDSKMKPIKYRKRPVSEAENGSGDDCDCSTACGCQSGGAAESEAVTDGGTRPMNVDDQGNLQNVEFTEPAEDTGQDIYEERPDKRPRVPEGVDLDTPDYAVRREMNDIESPDEKTWFMELDTAVIDNDRCIRCGTCVAACPSDSIGIGDDGLPELVKMCTGCSLCWDMCPRGGLRYERQWKITGGEDNVKGAGDPITEFSAKVTDDWREDAQDGGVVTSVLSHLLESGEIDGALIATESDDEPWKAESFLATSHQELVENAGSFYNQTMALGNLDLSQWRDKLPDKSWDDMSLALVGTPCEIEGVRTLQDFDWDYSSQEEGIRAIDYRIALMCTKNFNHQRLIGEQLEEKRGIAPEDIGKLDVLHGNMMVYDHEGEMMLKEDIEEFHDAALKGCDECADFTGYCADITVGSVGSSDEYSSVIIRTEQGLDAWELTAPDLEYHDLEDRSAIGGLQSWDKKKAFESLKRPFDPDAPRFIDYTDHAEKYGTELNPHEATH